MVGRMEGVTRLVQAARLGDQTAVDSLFGVVYEELRRLARVVRRGRAGETLNTTALVHEVYFKLVPSGNLSANDRAHFFRIVARAMRQVLVDAAEKRTAQKRGGGAPAITFNDRVHSSPIEAEKLMALEEALRRLEEVAPRQAQIVECRFFAGLSVEETAAAVGVSEPTLKRDWRAARAWLSTALQ